MSPEEWVIAVLLLVSVNSALVGSFLLLRKMSMVTDAMSHAVLFGIVVAILLSGSVNSFFILVGGTLACLATAYLSQFLVEKGKVQEDASLGISFTWLFAMGVILISLFARQVDIDQDCVLHGEIIYVPLETVELFGRDIGPKAFWELLVVFFFNLSLLILGRRNLTALAFDQTHARLSGLKPRLWNFLLLTAVSLTSVASFDAVGVILIVCLIVTPAATAFLFARSVHAMIASALIIGIVSVFSGYEVASLFDASVSASVAMMSFFLFLLVAFAGPVVFKQKML